MKELPFKGFILPNGKILSPKNTLSHESIAFNYFKEIGHYENYKNSNHSSAQDYLVYVLNAMQVRTGGKPVLVLLLKNHRHFSKYIAEYQSNNKNWKVLLLDEF